MPVMLIDMFYNQLINRYWLRKVPDTFDLEDSDYLRPLQIDFSTKVDMEHVPYVFLKI